MSIAQRVPVLWLCAWLGTGFAADCSEVGQGVARPLTADRIAACYSLDELQQAADYLLVVAESGPGPAAILSCDPDPATARRWLGGPMHALVDARRRVLEADYREQAARLKPAIAGCHARCTCNAYRHLLDAVDAVDAPMAADPDHLSNRALLDTEMVAAGPAQSRVCAARAQWFCDSALHRFLRTP